VIGGLQIGKARAASPGWGCARTQAGLSIPNGVGPDRFGQKPAPHRAITALNSAQLRKGRFFSKVVGLFLYMWPVGHGDRNVEAYAEGLRPGPPPGPCDNC